MGSFSLGLLKSGQEGHLPSCTCPSCSSPVHVHKVPGLTRLHISAIRVESPSRSHLLERKAGAGHCSSYLRDLREWRGGSVCLSRETVGGEVQGSHQCDQSVHTLTPVHTPTCVHTETCEHTDSCTLIDLCTHSTPVHTHTHSDLCTYQTCAYNSDLCIFQTYANTQTCAHTLDLFTQPDLYTHSRPGHTPTCAHTKT